MNTSPNDSSADTFWNRRYKDEGVLWGETRSPTAGIAKRHFLQGSRILEIGFGYGRDLIFLAKEGFKMTGVEPSHEGLSMAKTRLADSGINVEQMLNGEFETTQLPPAGFDGVLSHRFLHLLTTPEMVDSFLKRLLYVTCPEAIICIGARNLTDLDPAQMIAFTDGVFEYRHRPGHRISYWGQQRFSEVFGRSFDVLEFVEVTEQESKDCSAPCHLTVMVAKKKTIRQGKAT